MYIFITFVSYHLERVNLDQTWRKTKMDSASTFISDKIIRIYQGLNLSSDGRINDYLKKHHQ